MGENTTQTQDLIVALGAAGYAAFRMTLVGNQAPAVAAYFERVTHPQPGDLVVERTSFARHRHEAVGRMVSETGGLWRIESLEDGSVRAWDNCEWVAIPATPTQAREWAGR